MKGVKGYPGPWERVGGGPLARKKQGVGIVGVNTSNQGWDKGNRLARGKIPRYSQITKNKAQVAPALPVSPPFRYDDDECM